MTKHLFTVTAYVEGYRITGTLAAYNAEDAARLARSMIRANHGWSYATVTAVEAVR